MTSTTPAQHVRVPLWRDVRVLQWAFQLAVVALAAAVVMWLFGNYTANSEEQGIPTGFGFLDNPASFEITGNELGWTCVLRSESGLLLVACRIH